MGKLVRNYFALKGPIYLSDSPTQSIDWKFIEKLHFLQISKGMRLGNKLNTRHIHFQNDKMKVAPALQILSNSVFAALLYLKNINPEFANVTQTAIFCKTFNDMIDILNTCSIYDPCPTRQPITLDNLGQLRKKIDCFIKYIQNLQIEVDSKFTVDDANKIPVNATILESKLAPEKIHQMLFFKFLTNQNVEYLF